MVSVTDDPYTAKKSNGPAHSSNFKLSSVFFSPPSVGCKMQTKKICLKQACYGITKSKPWKKTQRETAEMHTRLLLTMDGGGFAFTKVFRFLKAESSLRRSVCSSVTVSSPFSSSWSNHSSSSSSSVRTSRLNRLLTWMIPALLQVKPRNTSSNSGKCTCPTCDYCLSRI